jgi:hypothetical protein
MCCVPNHHAPVRLDADESEPRGLAPRDFPRGEHSPVFCQEKSRRAKPVGSPKGTDQQGTIRNIADYSEGSPAFSLTGAAF